MKEIKPVRFAILKKNIKTRREEGIISGKRIRIEKERTIKEVLDTDFNNLSIAMANFIIRRTELLEEWNGEKKIYYGHVGYFGYYVAEDEILKWLD